VIVETFFAGLAAAAEGSAEGGARTALPLSRYSLLVAEDDGTLADPDFPEVRTRERLARYLLPPQHLDPHPPSPAPLHHLPPPPACLRLQIDPSVPITSVGVDKFVLVQRGAEPGASPRPGRAGEAAEGDVILLRVTIPQASIALRACEVGSGAAPSLLLTCYPPKDSGASSSFTVQLTGGGSARPLAGLAAPSQAGLAGLAAAEAAAGASLGAPP
jgi:hypothetical protein